MDGARPGPVALLFHAVLGGASFRRRMEPLARTRRPGARRDPRPSHGGAGDGREHGALQVDDVRRLGAVHGHRGRARGERCAVRVARRVQHLPVAHAAQRHRRGRARIDLGRVLRRALHPVRAEHRRPDLQGRAVGDLRRVPHRLHVPDAVRRRRPHRHAAPAVFASANREKGSTMNTNRRKTLVLGAAAAIGFFFIGSAHAQKKEIKLGQTMPYSGPASAYGTIGKLHQAYFKKINDEGGIGGAMINLISLDDGYSPPKTVEQVRKLVEQDEVDALFQTLGTPSNTAIHKYVNAKKVPHLYVATGATKWNDPKNFPWTFGFNLSYQAEGEIYAKYILKNKPTAKIAILYQNDDYGKVVLAGLQNVLKGDKAKMIVAKATYEVTDPTVDSQILTLKASGADTMINICTPKFSAQAIRRVYVSGWRPPLHIVNNVGSSVGSVLTPAGLDKSQGVITVQYYKDESDPEWKNDAAMLEWRGFMGKYYTAGNVLDASTVYAYITANLMLQPLQQCNGNFSRDNIRKQAESIMIWKHGLLLPGIVVNTSATDHAPVEQGQLAKFDGKKWTLFGDVLGGAG